MSTNYDIHADDGIQALTAEAESDSDVIGLVQKSFLKQVMT